MQLYDFAPIAYLSLTEHGLIAEANLTSAKLLGVERKKLINRRFAQYVKPEDGDQWHLHFLHAKQHREKQNCELTLRRTDDTLFQARLDCLYMEVEDAPPLMSIILTDITERKRAKEALRIASAAFETQNSIIVTDAQKVILRVNQAFSRITGYSAEEATGRNPYFLRSGLHGEDFYQAMWASVTRKGYWHGEIWDKRKNGEVLPLWLTLTAVTDSRGNITQYVGSFTDITAQKQAEKVLLDARQRLENQVTTTKVALEKLKEETTEVNTAINFLLKRRENDKYDAQNELSREVDGTILPFLKKLKGASTGRRQTTCLINILETNLLQLVHSFGRTANLPAACQQLTPVEAQVASMVRQGLPTKVIAATLNSSSGTVSIHRKHMQEIRFERKGNQSSQLSAVII